METLFGARAELFGDNADGTTHDGPRDGAFNKHPTISRGTPNRFDVLQFKPSEYFAKFDEQNLLKDYVDVRKHGANLNEDSLLASTSSQSSAVLPAARRASLRFNSTIEEGKSVVLRLEELMLQRNDPIAKLIVAARQVFGFPTTVHAYVSGVGDQALDPHTDPYDTVLFQMSGSKQWTTCVPITDAALAKETAAPRSAADRCRLHEVRTDHYKECTAFTPGAMSRMDCSQFTLTAGDLLYMPMSTIHYAINGKGVGTEKGQLSEHLTLGLLREGRQWSDLWQQLNIKLKKEHALDSGGGGIFAMFRSNTLTTAQTVIADAIDAVQASFRTVDGIEFAGALPLWPAAAAAVRRGAAQLDEWDVAESQEFEAGFERLLIRFLQVLILDMHSNSSNTLFYASVPCQGKKNNACYADIPVCDDVVGCF